MLAYEGHHSRKPHLLSAASAVISTEEDTVPR
jgi:hypothetical protein